jgi:hypothetical protein
MNDNILPSQIVNLMVEFAKYHRLKQIKVIKKNGAVSAFTETTKEQTDGSKVVETISKIHRYSDEDGMMVCIEVDFNSIENAYPEDNIK